MPPRQPRGRRRMEVAAMSTTTLPAERSDRPSKASTNGFWSLRGPHATRLPGYAYAYFELVEAEYRSLSVKNTDPSAEQEAHRMLTKFTHQQDLTWGDLYSLETAVLRLQPPERIRARAQGLRQQYKELCGQEAYDAYMEGKPPDPSDASTP